MPDPRTQRIDNPLVRIRAVWEAGAASYDACPGHALQSDRQRWAWRRLLQVVLDPLYRGTKLRILDIGTGTGAISLLLANMGCVVTGVDIAPAMLEKARRKAQILGVPLTLVEADANTLPFSDDTFDVVFSRHLFWTLPEPVTALSEWVRVARPGGIVAVADGWWEEPTAGMRRRRAFGRVVRKLVPSHGRDTHAYDSALYKLLPVAAGVSPYSIRYFLDQAGLERLKVRDLHAIRAAERRSMPPWYWIDQARHTWLATGYKPEA